MQISLHDHPVQQALEAKESQLPGPDPTLERVRAYLQSDDRAILQEVRQHPSGLDEHSWSTALGQSLHPALTGHGSASGLPGETDLRILRLLGAAAWSAQSQSSSYLKQALLHHAPQGYVAVPALLAIAEARDSALAAEAVSRLVEIDPERYRDRALAFVRKGLAEEATVAAWLPLARSFAFAVEARLWELFLGQSNGLRQTTAQALAGLGDTILPRLKELAGTKKADLRQGAIEALVALGTPGALEILLDRKERETNPEVRQRIMERLPGSADQSVPTLGFEPGKPRMLEPDLEVRIGPDLKLVFFSARSGKPAKTLPKQAGEAAKQAARALAGELKEAAAAQVARLESQLSSGHSWEVGPWKEQFLHHPLMQVLASRLIFLQGERTFRVNETLEPVDAKGKPVELDAHAPIRLAPSGQDKAWKSHLAKHKLEPLLDQL